MTPRLLFALLICLTARGAVVRSGECSAGRTC